DLLDVVDRLGDVAVRERAEILRVLGRVVDRDAAPAAAGRRQALGQGRGGVPGAARLDRGAAGRLARRRAAGGGGGGGRGGAVAAAELLDLVQTLLRPQAHARLERGALEHRLEARLGRRQAPGQDRLRETGGLLARQGQATFGQLELGGGHELG